MAGSVRHRIVSVLVGLGAGLALGLTYGLPFRWNRGPEGRWWEPFRRSVSRWLGHLDPRIGPRPITAAEYVGSFDMPLEQFEERLFADGFVRNPFSRLKTKDGDPEVGSWVYRDSPLARRQLHLMLFSDRLGGIAVYAHDELSNVNPLAGAGHFDGHEQDAARGVERARKRLPLEKREDASTSNAVRR